MVAAIYIFCECEGKPYREDDHYTSDAPAKWFDDVIEHAKLSPNWHQTILSREEYFSAYPVDACEAVDAELTAEDLALTNTPTIEQLAADYRTKHEVAISKQKEANEASDAAYAAFIALEKAMDALGFSIQVIAEPVQPTITDWRDLRVGDVIEYVDGDIKRKIGMSGPVIDFARDATDGMYVQMRCDDGSDSGLISWPKKWRFIRRP
jgi:hypothetical protein